MSAQQRSLQITERYRARLLQIRTRVDVAAMLRFPSIEQLDASDFPERMAAVMSVSQTEAVRASGGYLAAYVSSELGRRMAVHAVDSHGYAGLARDGRPLAEAYRSPLVAVLARLAEGADPVDAIDAGVKRARRMAEMDLMHAARLSLRDSIEREPTTSGWQRAVYGTCGACLGDIASTNAVRTTELRIHPNCRCVTQPVVTGVKDRFPLPTGTQIFEQMSPEERDRSFGADTAAALTAGDLSLRSLVDTSEMDTQQNFITQS